MERGQIVTSDYLIKDGWNHITNFKDSGLEVWGKGSMRCVVRIKTREIMFLYDKDKKTEDNE